MSEKLKIQFTLDETDLKFFRNLFRQARREARERSPDEIIEAVEELIQRVRVTKRSPNIVKEAATTLEDLIQMLKDPDYKLPRGVANEVLTALAYFANPQDLIADDIPGLGLLDDAIIVKVLDNEFKHELWGYRKFRTFRESAEQRPWTSVARKRLPERLEAYRKKIRAEIDKRKQERPTSWW